MWYINYFCDVSIGGCSGQEEVLERLDELGLDKSRFCIIAGGAMLMNGLRDKTDDIDIKMGETVF